MRRVRHAAARRLARLCDRPRELRHLELVAVQPDRDVPGGLPAVEHAEPEVDREDRHGREQPVDPRPRDCRGACACDAHSAADPRTTTGSRSRSRRTNRHVTPAAAQAATTASSRSRPASGIVTSTMSGRVRSSTCAISDVPPDDRDALKPPAPQARVVVDEAHDVLARRLAQLAEQAAAASSRADDQRPAARRVERREPARSRSLPEPRRADEDDADERVDHEHALREVPEVAGRSEHAERDELGGDDRRDDRDRVACAGIAPHAAVEAERDEREVARDEQDRQRGREDEPLRDRSLALDAQEVRREERRADQREVDDDLDETPAVHCEERRSRRPVAVGVGEQARKLHEQRERQEDAEQRHERVVQDGVREARPAERGGDEREQHDRALLRQPVVHEPVRCVVAAALVNRATFEQPHDRDERRVEDRHGEDQDRQQERRGGRARDLVARQEPEARDGEAEYLRAGVAHERLGGPSHAQVEAQEADAGEREREREHEHRVVRVDGDGVEREVACCDRRERRREPVHVVEEVERVRHPDEPDHAERHRDPVAPDDLDRQSAPQRDPRGAELRRELRPGGKRVQVVDEPCEEEHRAADRARPTARSSARALRSRPRPGRRRAGPRRCRARRRAASPARASDRR